MSMTQNPQAWVETKPWQGWLKNMELMWSAKCRTLCLTSTGIIHIEYVKHLIPQDCLTVFLCRIIAENNGKTPLTYKSMQAIVKKLGPPKRPLSAPSMEDLKSTIKNICTVLRKIRTWQLIQIHYLLTKMWTRLVQKAMRRNTGFPPWRTLAITLQIFRRSSSQEGSRRLWGDWRSTWKERY